jgi:hypothetical protein
MGTPVVPTGAVIVWLLIGTGLLVAGVFGPVIITMLIVRWYVDSRQRRQHLTRSSNNRLPIRRAVLISLTTICVVGPAVGIATFSIYIIDSVLTFFFIWICASAVVSSAVMARHILKRDVPSLSRR